jgi:hypothetical protein
MKIIKITIFLILTTTVQTKVLAETWNEPWQKEIIKKADYFVLAKVLSNIDSIGAEIEIIKYFGNQKLTGKILINGFSLLQMTSSSGSGVHFDFEKNQTFYFLLTKREDGNYAIPTPTSGYAILDKDEKVRATYRHSYHQALISRDIYEKTYIEIWNYYKTSEFNKENVLPFINEFIDKEPAGFGENEVSNFFLQHVALETAYLLKIPIALDRIKKFVESDNFHSRVSALRLLSNLNNKKTKEYLFDYIDNEQNENFEKVIAIWSLSKIGGKEYIEKLLSIAENQSDEETGFGGNIMDPRVGTHFPSPKSAIEQLK